MNATRTVIIAMIVAIAMIGMTGFAAATYTSVELVEKENFVPLADLKLVKRKGR